MVENGGGGDMDDKALREMEAANRQMLELKARQYQMEMFDLAKKENTVVCLGTGTGKTFISVLLIKHLEHQIAGDFDADSKRTVFLVPTVPLVEQQSNVLKQHLSVNVGMYIGAMQVDMWSDDRWLQEFRKNGVLVMTPAIFNSVINHGYLPLSKVNLIVFDECHRATGDDPYVGVMKLYKEMPRDQRPKILGLTASVVNAQTKGIQVSKKIRELEATLFARAVTVTEGCSDFGTKPEEVVVVYRMHNPHNQLPLDEEKMLQLKGCLDFKEFRKGMNALKQVYETCGSYCAKQLVEFRERELEKAEKAVDASEDFVQKAPIKKELFLAMHRFLGKPDVLDIPSKMRKLLEVLGAFKDINLCGIVFVKERLTVYSLFRWSQELATRKEWSFIRPAFIVGHNQNPFGHDGDPDTFKMNAKAQRKVVQNFRDGVYNLMFATSVVEEGMDVPVCNLIVRFDLPPDVRSYIQSKGRARAKPALYVLLTDDLKLLETEAVMDNFQEIEKLVAGFCAQSRITPDVSESHLVLQDDPDLQPYIYNTARIPAQSAVQIINWYCQTLLKGPYSNIIPVYEFEETPDGYICTLQMPILCPARKPIVGKCLPTKDKAKIYVSLEMCRLLHGHGELNDRLIPRKKMERVDHLPLTERDVKVEGQLKDVVIRTGIKKRFVFNRSKSYLLETRGEDFDVQQAAGYHLYVIKTNVVRKASDLQNWRGDEQLFDPQEHNTWIGILLRDKIPNNLPKFPIFTRSGEELVDIVYAGKVQLDTEVKALCNKFNRFVFYKVLEIVDNGLLPCENFTTPCTVPVMEDSPGNFKINREVLSKIGPPFQPKYGAFEFEKELYEDGVVELMYRINENIPEVYYHRYYVKKIREDYRPDHTGMYPFDLSMSFAKYVAGKQMRIGSNVVSNKDQPLLEVEHVQSRLEMITPRFEDRRGNKFVKKDGQNLKNRKTDLILPEFVFVLPMKAHVWRKVTSIPSILHRLNRLLVAEDIRISIIRHTALGAVDIKEPWPQIKFELMAGDKTIQTSSNQFGMLVHSEVRVVDAEKLKMTFVEQPKIENCSGPSPGEVMKALTTRSANDCFDLERLELLGDSFLKIVATLFLYDKYPNLREGELTAKRSYHVCNRNLLRRALEVGFTEAVETVRFDGRYNFIPPGFRTIDIDEKYLLKVDFKRLLIGSFGYEYDGSPKLTDGRKTQNFEEVFNLVKEVFDDEEATLYALDQNFLEGQDLCKFPIRKIQDYKAKVAADAVEAMIGLYLEKCGPVGAMRFLKWIGLDFGEAITDNFLDCFTLEHETMRTCTEEEIRPFLHHIQKVERELGYVFKNKLLALQAISHCSFRGNTLTSSCEKLEFLGDAITDYLLTMYIYQLNASLDPGQLTDLRTSLVNNQIFAHVVVKNNIDTSLLYTNNNLFTSIKKYVENIEEIGLKMNTVLGDWETDDVEDAEVPKPLGDLLEAIIGAVFLDTGKSLEAVWNILVKVMGYEIQTFSHNIPIPPVKELVERFPDTFFEKPVEIYEGEDEGKVSVTMNLKRRDGPFEKYTQTAKNKKLAKTILAKKYLRKTEREERMREVQQKKKEGEEEDEVKTLTDAMISSEMVKGKYYRK